MAFYYEGISPNHKRGKMIVNGRLDGFRGVPGFTETYQPGICVDSYPYNVSRIADSHSFYEFDLQEL
mgnify:CR=1 FL=1|jgi:hypothetical protein